MIRRVPVFTLAWTLSAFALLGAGASSRLAPESSGPHQPVPARREAVAIFGVDAADWRVIDRLVANGQLPAFARLKEVAALGVLQAEAPLLSPIIWTTIVTGRQPEDHGVLDFMTDRPGGGQVPVSGGARRVKALWEIFSDRGRAVAVTGWWATWPADKVRGVIVSDRVAAPHMGGLLRPDAGLVQPPSALTDISRLVVGPEQIDYAALARLLPVSRAEFERAEAAGRQAPGALYRDRVAHFRAAVASARTYRRIGTHLARSVKADFWAAYYEVVDTASHLFVMDAARADRVIASAYREVDEALSEAARALDPDALMLVVSDHGFQPADAGIREDPADLTAGATAWHRPYGIIAAVKAGVLAGTRQSDGRRVALGIVSPLDIAPTLLARVGLPVAADMPGRVIAALAPPEPPARIPSYGAHTLPEAPADGRAIAAAELERLRALGYVSGAAAVTSLARVNLGEILYRHRDYRGASRELEAVLRADPLNTRAVLWLARAYVELRRRDEAVALYDRLIQAARSTSFVLDPVVVLAATDLDLDAGRTDAVRGRLQRLPIAVRESPEGRLAAAALAEAQGRTAEAERAYREVLAAAPSDFDALQRLMDLLLRARRTGEAAAATASAARRFASSPQHLSLAGEAALSDRRYADGARFFSRALQLAPGADAPRLGLARAQLLAGGAEAALATLREAAASRDAHMLRGASLSALRRWTEAEESLQQALHSAAPSPDVLNALAAAQLGAGHTDAAVRSLELSLALQPDQPAARALLEQARKR